MWLMSKYFSVLFLILAVSGCDNKKDTLPYPEREMPLFCIELSANSPVPELTRNDGSVGINYYVNGATKAIIVTVAGIHDETKQNVIVNRVCEIAKAHSVYNKVEVHFYRLVKKNGSISYNEDYILRRRKVKGIGKGESAYTRVRK